MNPTREATLQTLHQVSQKYLDQNDGVSLQKEAARWRPRPGLWGRMQQASRWLPGVRLRQQPIDDHVIHYWQLGPRRGIPVVLVHGFASSKENWLTLLPLLRRGYTLYVPDLPGFGQSGFRHDQCYSYGAQARRLAQWAEQRNLPPAHWVGSSMGGAICANLAAKYPGQVLSVTLMNAAGLGAETLSTTDQVLMEGGNMLIPHNLLQTRELFRVTTHRGKNLISLFMAPAMYRDLRHRAPISRHIFADMLRQEEEVADLVTRIQAPVKIFWGDKDQVLDVSCAYRFADLIPGASLTVLKNVGHLPMLEAPLKTARILREFWQQAAPDPSRPD